MMKNQRFIIECWDSSFDAGFFPTRQQAEQYIFDVLIPEDIKNCLPSIYVVRDLKTKKIVFRFHSDNIKCYTVDNLKRKITEYLMDEIESVNGTGKAPIYSVNPLIIEEIMRLNNILRDKANLF